MVVVKKKKGESEDRLISRFRKKVLYEGLLIEIRDRERYKKPSEKNKHYYTICTRYIPTLSNTKTTY